MMPPPLTSVINGDARFPGRRFPGLPTPENVETTAVTPREARCVHQRADDLLSIEGVTPAHRVHVCAFDAQGRDGLALLGLPPDAILPQTGYDSGPLEGWMQARGLTTSTNRPSATLSATSDPLLLKARDGCDIWIISLCAEADLTAGTTPGSVTLSVSRAQTSAPLLPQPLGPVRDEFTIPRGTARAYALAPGEIVQVIDVEGQQCSDFMAFRAAGLDRGQEEAIDSTATRSMVRRSYPMPGLFDTFHDAEMRPLMHLVQDTCGRHDTFGLACTARGYADRGFPGHINCSDNISDAMAPYGIARRAAWPAINFFWSTWIDPHHHIQTEESWSRPGDYVALRAAEALVCVSTACPDDIDPINGWNPTDVHVRIHRADTPVRRAIAHREQEAAPMRLSEESPFHPATSRLTRDFAPARATWVPTSYAGLGPIAEYRACRDAVTLQDTSPLRKYDIVGPDAGRLLQHALTRDIARLPVWRGTYALLCDPRGEVIDDGTLFRLGDQLFRWCCGTEESARHLTALADAQGFQVRINAMGDALPSLALQGPRARDVLRGLVHTRPHVPSLDDLRWFGVTSARLGDRDGLPFLLTRTGYTGELGYELFCAASDGVALWDAIMVAGDAHDLRPMGTAALEILRVEAGLAASGAEFAPGVDAFEAGLGFAVDLRKDAFVGRDALARNAASPRRTLTGLRFDRDEAPTAGAPVLLGERQVGTITSATRSPDLGCAIAMARLAVEVSEVGTMLEVGQMDGRMKRLSAKVTTLPFLDPDRTKPRA